MAGPVTLVTGVSRGIGRGIADYLIARGHTVVGIARTAPGPDYRGEFRAIDLSDAEATEAGLGDLAATWEIDNLVNNAGVARHMPLEAITPDVVHEIMDVNIRAVIQCAQAVLPAMRAKGRGRIVNIGSRSVFGKPGRSVYGASKAGIGAMTRTWALELAGAGITVNCVAPGPIATEMFDDGNPPGSPGRIAIEQGVAVGRLGTPQDIAAAVNYFLSDDAGFCTGQTLNVCGGLTIGVAPQ